MLMRALTPEWVFEILDRVMDPEVPVLSVVELGIVREARIDEATGAVTVVVTPTYSGCPAMKVIEDEIVSALHAEGIAEARVKTVYAPAWTTDWLSAEARRKLVAYGIAAPGPASRDDELVPLRRRATVVHCPYCESTNTRVESEFGSTACKSICYCNDCRQPFELFKAI
jgi:ring-1,2-phenylacetyl-CoA epoxidase subunit PaaD